jgi:hypothetical protein
MEADIVIVERNGLCRESMEREPSHRAEMPKPRMIDPLIPTTNAAVNRGHSQSHSQSHSMLRH